MYKGTNRLLKAARTLLETHGITPENGKGYRFKNPPYEDLLIHILSDHLWTLTHFRTDGALDLCVGILFDTETAIPVYIDHGWLPPQRLVYVNNDTLASPTTKDLALWSANGIIQLDSFAGTFATNLKDQGFDAKLPFEAQAIEGSHPVMAVLPRWMFDYQKQPAETTPFIIHVDGTIEPVAVPNDDGFELKYMQSIVDGYIELVHLPNGDLMVINEEGLFSEPVNPVASVLINVLFRKPTIHIHGRVLVCRNSMVK